MGKYGNGIQVSDGNGNEVIEMGKNWYEKSVPAHLYYTECADATDAEACCVCLLISATKQQLNQSICQLECRLGRVTIRYEMLF